MPSFKNENNKENMGKGLLFASKIGNLLEKKVGEKIESSNHAPILEGNPQEKQWYRIPLEEGLCGDGSPYYIYLNKGKSNHLCLFFSGGGVAWNRFTASNPTTAGKMLTGLPNYYWNNLRPVTQLMNINIGITDVNDPKNPFADWNFVIITYATGDFHIGDHSFPYEDEEGNEKTLHFHGLRNYKEAMKVAKNYFPRPDKLLIAGNSAGAFAVSALAGDIYEKYYPNCKDKTILSDSGQLVYDNWKYIAQELWHAPQELCEALSSGNPTLDWFRRLYDKYGEEFRYLYTSSTHDYLLSAYYNDITNKVYETDEEVQQIFYEQMCQMVHGLKEITDGFGIYLNSMKLPGITQGGTVHTCVRELYFHNTIEEEITMAQWLNDAVYGTVYDVGMQYL
jgi:hypothetical protein